MLIHCYSKSVSGGFLNDKLDLNLNFDPQNIKVEFSNSDFFFFKKAPTYTGPSLPLN